MAQVPHGANHTDHEFNFEESTKQWIEEGGGHHTVVSTALTAEDMKLFAKFTDTEIVIIG